MEYPWLGPVVTTAWLIPHLCFSANQVPVREDLVLILASGVIGYLLDSTLVLLGFMTFPEATRLGWPSTVWMVALWMGFAATFNGCMSWLKGRYLLGILAGAIFAPLAYRAGVYLDALEFDQGVLSLAAVALAWSLAMAVLLYLQARLSATSIATGRVRSS